MSKEFEINTLQDIINCTDESNIDNFLVDLKTFIEMNHALQKVVDVVATTEKQRKISIAKFIWIDDGKHDGTITITAK